MPLAFLQVAWKTWIRRLTSSQTEDTVLVWATQHYMDAMLMDGLNDAFTGKHSGLITDEYLVPKYGVTREEQDQFAYESHMKAAKAIQEGKFSSQIVPIQVSKEFVFQVDENVRPDTHIRKTCETKTGFQRRWHHNRR